MKKNLTQKIEIEIRKNKRPDYKFLLKRLNLYKPNSTLRDLKVILHEIRKGYKDKKETLIHNGVCFKFSKRGTKEHIAWVNRTRASIETQRIMLDLCK